MIRSKNKNPSKGAIFLKKKKTITLRRCLLHRSLLSMSDIFDDVILLEERMRKHGVTEGIEIGRERGLTEGYEMGFKNGFAVAIEMSSYHDFVKMIRDTIDAGEKQFSERYASTQKLLQSHVPAVTALQCEM